VEVEEAGDLYEGHKREVAAKVASLEVCNLHVRLVFFWDGGLCLDLLFGLLLDLLFDSLMNHFLMD